MGVVEGVGSSLGDDVTFFEPFMRIMTVVFHLAYTWTVVTMQKGSLISAQWLEFLMWPSIVDVITKTVFALMGDFWVSSWNSLQLLPALISILGGYSSSLDLNPTVLNHNVQQPVQLLAAGWASL